MKSKRISRNGESTYAIVFDQGDEVVSGLKRFARDNGLSASHFTAIGALQSVTLGFFDWEKKDYEKIPIDEQVEVVSMVGDVSLKDGEPKVHTHLVVAGRDGRAFGGHLLEAHVRPTLEVVLTESTGEMQRNFDETSGLALIDLSL